MRPDMKNSYKQLVKIGLSVLTDRSRLDGFTHGTDQRTI